ncbi:cobaltochelatase, CobS subunit domain protein [Brucella lupini]|uniref:Cobaltochelatase, CobS subunit domain protein n=1 Tax=Brucella lupini TaxID=255457 RepID=A0A256GQV8_9HYPH|nr:cobaltochelatase, CobS subunit domain protein [Brucella lupini]
MGLSPTAPTDILLPRDCVDASTDARNELRKGHTVRLAGKTCPRVKVAGR